MEMINKCQEIAKNIFNELGSDFDECIYQKAFEIELRLCNMRYENARVVPIFYKGFNVGEAKTDLLVNDNLVIELKAIASALSPKEETQLKTYMKSLNINSGLLINFPQAGRKEIPLDPEFIELPHL